MLCLLDHFEGRIAQIFYFPWLHLQLIFMMFLWLFYRRLQQLLLGPAEAVVAGDFLLFLAALKTGSAHPVLQKLDFLYEAMAADLPEPLLVGIFGGGLHVCEVFDRVLAVGQELQGGHLRNDALLEREVPHSQDQIIIIQRSDCQIGLTQSETKSSNQRTNMPTPTPPDHLPLQRTLQDQLQHSAPIILLMTDPRLNPLRLPPSFHGTPKPYRTPSQINRELSQHRENPQFVQTRVSNWQQKRFNSDVEAQRRQFLVHPAKISNDTPQWFKTTYHYFQRNNYSAISNNTTKSHLDTTNKFHESPSINLEASSNRTKRQVLVSNKINTRDPSLRSMNWQLSGPQVTNKVGSVVMRDYSIRRPQLKIGGSRPQNFINTYSVF